jgi:hypothetical protein
MVTAFEIFSVQDNLRIASFNIINQKINIISGIIFDADFELIQEKIENLFETNKNNLNFKLNNNLEVILISNISLIKDLKC